VLHLYVLVLNVHIRFMISYKSFRIIIIIGVLTWLTCKRRQEYAEHKMSIYF